MFEEYGIWLSFSQWRTVTTQEWNLFIKKNKKRNKNKTKYEIVDLQMKVIYYATLPYVLRKIN